MLCASLSSSEVKLLQAIQFDTNYETQIHLMFGLNIYNQNQIFLVFAIADACNEWRGPFPKRSHGGGEALATLRPI